MPEDSSNHNLPVLVEPYRSVEPLRVSSPVLDAVTAPAPLPITHYLWILKRHRWKIIPFVLACSLASLIISARLQPIYEARTTIDVDRQTPSGVIGQDAMRTAVNDAEPFLATQVRLIQSDSVLRPVAQKYKLLELEKGSSWIESPQRAARSGEAPVTLKNLKVDSPRKTYLI